MFHYFGIVFWLCYRIDIKLFCFGIISWFFVLAMIHRGTSAKHQIVGRNIGYKGTVHVILQSFACCYFSNDLAIKVPLLKNRLNIFFTSLLHYNQHSFLTLGKQYFKRLHSCLTGRHFIQVNNHTMFSFSAHFAR